MDTPVPVLAKQLRGACSFVEVATCVCRLTAQLGLHDCVVTLHGPSGNPVLGVDNVRGADPRERLAHFVGGWTTDRALRPMREHHAAIEVPGRKLSILVLPLLEPMGLIGAIRCRHRGPFTADLRCELALLATHVSVRLAQLGIAVPLDSAAPSLTPRQLCVALLAARGHTNLEIATELDLSVNTVKKHLKDVFDRMQIGNRTELSSVLSRGGLDSVVPVGVIEIDGVTVTKTTRD